jgi:hypothetical protein
LLARGLRLLLLTLDYINALVAVIIASHKTEPGLRDRRVSEGIMSILSRPPRVLRLTLFVDGTVSLTRRNFSIVHPRRGTFMNQPVPTVAPDSADLFAQLLIKKLPTT